MTESDDGPAGERAARISIDDPVVAALRRHDTATVLRLLEEGVRQRGLAAFVTDQMARLNVDVGLAWARGELEVFEARLSTDGEIDWLASEPLSPTLAGPTIVPNGAPAPYVFTTYEQAA